MATTLTAHVVKFLVIQRRYLCGFINHSNVRMLGNTKYAKYEGHTQIIYREIEMKERNKDSLLLLASVEQLIGCILIFSCTFLAFPLSKKKEHALIPRRTLSLLDVGDPDLGSVPWI